MLVREIFNGTLELIVLAVIGYALGWVSNELTDILFAKKREAKLQDKVQHAIEAIYEAEKRIKGSKKGAERLVLACKLFMDKTKSKNYAEAEREILAVFPITKLSKK